MLELCGEGPFEFSSTCVRTAWSALVPFTLVLLLSIPISFPSIPFLRSYLTLDEAEAFILPEYSEPLSVKPPSSLWRGFLFVTIGLIETLAHSTYLSYSLIVSPTPDSILSGVFALTWLYTVLRPVTRPTQTVPFDLFAIYLMLFAGAVLQIGGILYDKGVFGDTWPSIGISLTVIGNLIATATTFGVVLGMPMALPSESVRREDIGVSVSPEDYTTLFGWITFDWVYPLLRQGRDTTLNESDVWNLSPTLQSRSLFGKFMTFSPQMTLLYKLWAANSLDLILDFLLTILSVAFNYAGPFFLKRILDIIDTSSPSRESRTQAYIYAFLAFLCALCKSQADAQHLWYGRRAATRVRTELMAAIYDKALKRKDFSGIVDREKEDKAKTVDDKKGKKESTDDPKAGAGVGKIVNLMSGDANRISMTVTAIHVVYAAPFEIIFASIFLYQLLGLAAFSGFFVLLLGYPLHSYVAKRSISIHKGLLAARDKRMGVLSELMGAIKFVKFFAWEDRWIKKVMECREGEMTWMIKWRLNSIIFSLLLTSAPIVISVVAFLVYVMQGNQLTVSTAFTAIALFNMVRTPLNSLPNWIVQILQTGVTLNRITVYLAEDEVDEQVSSLKKDTLEDSEDLVVEEPMLGIENGWFKWNEVEVEESKGEDKKKKEKGADGQHGNETQTLVTQDTRGDSTDALDSTDVDMDHKFELRDINIRFPEGDLTLITGPTASGKTALLMALLGEMTLLPRTPTGRILMSKHSRLTDPSSGLTYSISYAAQAPWLRHQSIRDNILFDTPFDDVRYHAVLDACALTADLEVLEDGDLTEIGARGVNLSGGQKARVALARAVYSRAKWVLLDDPLSAVDSGTAEWIVEKLLKGELLKGRTVVLVTHHVELVLPTAGFVVRMLDGRIDTQGTVKNLRARGVLDDLEEDEAAVMKDYEQKAVGADSAGVDGLGEGEDKNGKDEMKKPKKLVKDEHREVGGVKWAIYRSYLKASSYWIWVLLALLVFLTQILGLSEKAWIMIWGEAYKDEESTTSPLLASFRIADHPDNGLHINGYHSPDHSTSFSTIFTVDSGRFGINWPHAVDHPMFYVGVYAFIGLANMLVGVALMAAQYTGALRASRILFKRLLETVVRATFRFHDTTPQGRLLNRFGKDIETIDTSLAASLQAVNSSLANVFAAVILVAVVFPWFLVPAIFIGFAYRELAITYLNTGRDLRRMESNTRSPIFSDFGELLEGIVTVRAFSAERRFLDSLHKKIDVTTKLWYSYWMTNRWLLLRFDVLGALSVLITTLFSIMTLADGAGLAGICITSAMAFTSWVYWTCRFWTGLELDLNSVERVVEYLDLPQEPSAIIESNRPPAYWPSSTNNDSLIVVEDLSIKYAPDLPSVLQNISFALKAGERVGLLGRTGSGKSTLAMSILRFVDPTNGRILIDGVDISTIGIHDLRSRLTFIPQDAALFSGTLRENLDPFNEHTDVECLDVLQRCHMISSPSGSHSASHMPSGNPSPAASIHSPEHQGSQSESISTAATEIESKTTISLDTQVSAGGTNFSQGQRQLIAMARALLRRSSIIVLDEATSSIDFATDARIQTTIREEFNSSLLLTIAHRLRTVIDYDRLIVLEKGQIAEFDTPWKLIQKEDGIFRNMCLKSGTFSDLEAMAKSKAERGDQL